VRKTSVHLRNTVQDILDLIREFSVPPLKIYDVLSCPERLEKHHQSSPCDISGLDRMFWSIENKF